VSVELVVLPDWLAAMSEWLRDQSELTDLIDQRIYTELPPSKTFPLARIAHITDPPITGPAHWAVDATFQLDVWGGPKAITWTIAETARALITQRFSGHAWDLTAGRVVAGRVRAGGIRRTTDAVTTAGTDADNSAETASARPRARFDFAVVLHP
jgi:hypothetical protein